MLALDLADPGLGRSLFCEFRGSLLGRDATERLLARVLDAAREAGLLKARGRQRTDSTHVLAAVRELNQIELLAETLRAALNAITAAAPDWLRAVAHPDWHERYGRRIEDRRSPETGPKRDAYVVQVGTDGYQLLDALAEASAGVAALPAVAVLRRVWARHLEQDEDGRGGGTPPNVRLQSVEGRGPGDRIESLLRRGRAIPVQVQHELDGLHGPPDRSLRCGRPAPCPARRHGREAIPRREHPRGGCKGRQTCMKPCASRRSTRRWRTRAWLRPST